METLPLTLPLGRVLSTLLMTPPLTDCREGDLARHSGLDARQLHDLLSELQRAGFILRRQNVCTLTQTGVAYARHSLDALCTRLQAEVVLFKQALTETTMAVSRSVPIELPKRVKVLTALYESTGQPMYLSQLIEQTKLVDSTVASALKRFEAAGWVWRRTEKRDPRQQTSFPRVYFGLVPAAVSAVEEYLGLNRSRS